MDRFKVNYRLVAANQAEAEALGDAIALEDTLEIPRKYPAMRFQAAILKMSFWTGSKIQLRLMTGYGRQLLAITSMRSVGNCHS